MTPTRRSAPPGHPDVRSRPRRRRCVGDHRNARPPSRCGRAGSCELWRRCDGDLPGGLPYPAHADRRGRRAERGVLSPVRGQHPSPAEDGQRPACADRSPLDRRRRGRPARPALRRRDCERRDTRAHSRLEAAHAGSDRDRSRGRLRGGRLGKALPDRAIAPYYGNSNVYILSAYDDAGRANVQFEIDVGGWGARRGHDGPALSVGRGAPLSDEPCTDPHMQAFSGFAAQNADPANGLPRRIRYYGFVDLVTSSVIVESAPRSSSAPAKVGPYAWRRRCCTR